MYKFLVQNRVFHTGSAKLICIQYLSQLSFWARQNRNIGMVILTSVIVHFVFFPAPFLMMSPAIISLLVTFNAKWHLLNHELPSHHWSILKRNASFLDSYLWRMSSALFNIAPDTWKCLCLHTFRNVSNCQILQRTFFIVKNPIQPTWFTPIRPLLMEEKLKLIFLLVWFFALPTSSRLRVAAQNVSLEHFKTAYKCTVPIQSLLRMMRPFIMDGRSPSMSKTPGSVSGNVKLNTNIRILSRIATNLSSIWLIGWWIVLEHLFLLGFAAWFMSVTCLIIQLTHISVMEL